jgi:hypothetical protein
MQLRSRRILQASFVRLIALVCACAPWWLATSASAQADQILVVSGEKVSDNLSEAVSEALADVGSVMSPSSYTGKLRGREPDSEEALTKVAPQTGATLIVVLQLARAKLKVELRSGRDGTGLPGRAKRPTLAKPARKKLITAAKRALKKIGPMPAAKPASTRDVFAEESESESEPEQPSRAAAPARQPAKPVRPVQQEEAQDEDEEEQENPFGAAAAADEEESPRDAESPSAGDDGMVIRLHAGLGLGTRSILVPTPPMSGRGNRIDTSYVPALDIGASLELGLGPNWRLRFLADYRTVFGLTAGYLTPANLMTSSSLSSHSLIAGASLGHLSDGRDSFGVHVFLGWAYRSLTPDQPNLPSASIQGLVLRPEVEIPIANRLLTLRLAPELILILVPNATLPMNDNGLAKAVGVALGIEASIDLHISKTIGLSLQFRESRGSTASGWTGQSAVENERYIALRLLVQF